MIIFLTFATENEKSRFEYVYNTYKKLLLFKAYNILRDYSAAEDAVSEAFIRIYKNLDKIEDLDSNKTISFLVTIVKNISITILNKEKRQAVVVPEEFEHEDSFNLEEFVISEAAAEDMLGLIGNLNEELKTPFLLKYAHGLSHREISRLLNISENNVTVRIHRAKKKLITLFSQEVRPYEI